MLDRTTLYDPTSWDRVTLEAIRAWQEGPRPDQRLAVEMVLDMAEQLRDIAGRSADGDERRSASHLATLIMSVGIGVCVSQAPGIGGNSS